MQFSVNTVTKGWCQCHHPEYIISPYFTPFIGVYTEFGIHPTKGLPPYVFIMIGLYSGLRREEILALQWDCVHLDVSTPYISVRRAWRTEHNRPVISTVLKTEAAKRDIPIPKCLVECLQEAKVTSISDYVIADSKGHPLSYSQFQRVWQYVVVRSTKERAYYKYVNGQSIKYTVNNVSNIESLR